MEESKQSTTMQDEPAKDLLDSYTRAIYRVDADPEPIFLRAGEPSPELDRWLAARGEGPYAFVSAANPRSVPLSAAENERRHLQLGDRLRASGHSAIPGESFEATSGSFREASFLVVGIDRESAIALAREFGQLALLLGGIGRPVELHFTGVAKNGDAGL